MTPRRTPLTVVVPTRDRPGLLAGSLASLLEALDADDEVIVVDSASNDAASVRTAAEGARARLVRCERPGAARARNAGWQHASHGVVAFIDDDVRVAPTWPDAVVAAFDDPEVHFLTGRIGVPPDEASVQRPVAVKDDDHSTRIDRASRGHVGQSANMAARQSALVAVGGFDEELGPGSDRAAIAEDTDLFDRFVGAGLAGRYEASARAWHVQWRDKQALFRLDWRYGRGNGMRLAKLARMDPRRVPAVAVDCLWGWGGRELVGAIGQGNKTNTLTVSLRMLGTVVGAVHGLLIDLDHGHYVERRRARS